MVITLILTILSRYVFVYTYIWYAEVCVSASRVPGLLQAGVGNRWRGDLSLQPVDGVREEITLLDDLTGFSRVWGTVGFSRVKG